ncbi:hypothetical protein [Streptomyces sp. NPDC005438]|uniref:hypothetical protein n=1 Tax=Streptomyces sp. NPDC005438 TaxID=3156880 RepID=UPI0033A9A605
MSFTARTLLATFAAVAVTGLGAATAQATEMTHPPKNSYEIEHEVLSDNNKSFNGAFFAPVLTKQETTVVFSELW